MKIRFINKILLGVEIIPAALMLLLALLLSGYSRPIIFFTLVLSILSMISIIYIMIKTIMGMSENINIKYIYLSHIGFIITILGILSLVIFGNEFKNHSPDVPFSIFAFGIVVCVPYFHVMMINRFFRSNNALKRE